MNFSKIFEFKIKLECYTTSNKREYFRIWTCSRTYKCQFLFILLAKFHFLNFEFDYGIFGNFEIFKQTWKFFQFFFIKLDNLDKRRKMELLYPLRGLEFTKSFYLEENNESSEILD